MIFSERLFEAPVCGPMGRGGKGINIYPLASIALDQISGPRALTHQHFLLHVLGRHSRTCWTAERS